MDAVLCVKGKRIGTGRPLVCVPVMEQTREGIVAEVQRLVQLHVDMVEWRVDAFAGIESLNAIREVLAELAPLVEHTILVYTFRSKQQGGLLELDAERVYDIHQVAAESHVVDFIDLEMFETRKPEREIRKLQEMGTHVIASHHDFDETPEKTVIRMLLEQINESGADIVKLALMPQCMQDVWNLLEETERFHTKYPNRPVITMSMGALGGITRVAGEFDGSCVSFGAGKTASAPGQLEMGKLTEVLDILHESLK